MITVTLAEEAAPPWARLKKHSVAAGVRRAIGDTVLNCVDVDPGPNCADDSFSSSTLHNLFHREIEPDRLLAMQQGCRDPNFVRYLDARLLCYLHGKNP
jgi:hypothetical protein